MNSSINSKTQKIVTASMFAALVCIATMIIKIPSPLKGYINIGDCIVLISGWILSPAYAFLAAGIGSALADIFSGYIIYAPATFIIKGLMALVTHVIFHSKIFNFKNYANKIFHFSRIISGLLAELLMITGYWVFESLLYGPASAMVNIPANAIQGLFGLILGCVLIPSFEKTNSLSRYGS